MKPTVVMTELNFVTRHVDVYTHPSSPIHKQNCLGTCHLIWIIKHKNFNYKNPRDVYLSQWINSAYYPYDSAIIIILCHLMLQYYLYSLISEAIDLLGNLFLKNPKFLMNKSSLYRWVCRYDGIKYFIFFWYLCLLSIYFRSII